MALQKNFRILLEGITLQSKFKNLNYDCVEILQTIEGKANRLHKLNEMYCNGDIAEKEFDLKAYEVKKQIADKTKEINRTLDTNFICMFQADPRGWPLKIGIYDNERNDFDVLLYPFNSF